MPKLLILPGACKSLGGTLVTLSLLIKGFESCGASEQLSVLVWSGSLMERYLQEAGQGSYLKTISASNQPQFLQQALRWVNQQPRDWPLLLDNCVARDLIAPMILAAPALRLSGRCVYHFFHDLALSYNHLGYLARRLAFTLLAPGAMCNSKFTAGYIQRLVGDVQGILYQPVDTQRFNEQPPLAPPLALESILRPGVRLMLTPSRIRNSQIVNNKNLQALIPVLAHLKANGHSYHGVIVGQDRSPNRTDTRALLESAEREGVADCLTILPPTFAIEEYYKYADVVVTLAQREPFGRTVVEAIACGVPVVGSKTGGIGEILDNFAPEWTVDPNDPVAAAEAIVRIAADPNTPHVLARGKNWVKAQCSMVAYARRIIEITGLAPAVPTLVKL